MEIAIIVLLSTLLVLFIAFVMYFIIKNHRDSNNSNADAYLKDFSFDIKSSLKDELHNLNIEIMKQFNSSNEMNNAKLERFLKNIEEVLTSKFNVLTTTVQEKLTEINKKVEDKLTESFEKTNKTFLDITSRLVAIDEAQKNIESLSNDVVSLKGVLQNNQTRGQYGELQLQAALESIFGPYQKDRNGAYELQYTIYDSDNPEEKVRPDAVVFMPEPVNLICIDSKFPFQEYKKFLESNDEKEKDNLKKEFKDTIRKHVKKIAESYIINNVTGDYAIIFISNDGVFGFIHENYPELIVDARNKGVVFTSPSTLQPILGTFKMIRISSEASKNYKKINDQIAAISKEFKGFNKEWDKLSRNIQIVSKTKDTLDNRVHKMNNKIERISDSGGVNEEISTEDDKIEELE